MLTMAGAARGAGHLFAINLCVGVCANRTGGHCVVSTICHGRQEGRRGRRAGGGGSKSGIFLLRFGEFVCLAICVTKKHSLLNFIRRNGRMGVAYDNTLIMHCMLLWECVCVCECVCGCICVDSLLPADFVVAFACGSCHCSTPLFLSSHFSPTPPLSPSSGCLSRIPFHFCCALTLHDSFGFGVQFSLCLWSCRCWFLWCCCCFLSI